MTKEAFFVTNKEICVTKQNKYYLCHSIISVTMKNTTQKLFGWPATILHYLLLPVLYFSFVLLYSPGDMKTILGQDVEETLFNLTMISCILMGTLIISRLIFHFLRKVMRLNYVLYGCWCFGEMTVFNLFGAMYLTLASGRQMAYHNSLLFFLVTTIMILVFPYVVLALSFVVHGYRCQQEAAEANPGLIKFRDEKNRMKIAVQQSSILYIEASENYVIICYLDDSTVKRYTLRTSMRKIEPLVTSHGLVRCQRAYFLNPEHVRFLGRDKEGYIFAELDNGSVPHIPISRTYYGKLASLL